MQQKLKTDPGEEQLAALAEKIRAESRTPASAIAKFCMAMLSNPSLLRTLVEMYFAGRVPHVTRDRDASVIGAGLQRRDTRIAGARPNEPSESRKRAQMAIREKLALTVLDTFKVYDGRSIGKVMFFELPKLRRRSLRDAYIFDALSQYVANPSSNARIEDAIKPDQFEGIVQEAERITNAPV